MSNYTIGEVAERSGFTASALRFYEGIGLVQPATRTDAGYRIYDDRTVARLAFITRAKQLGCSLEEITDLVSIWDADRCGSVQRRFHHLITDKIRTAQQHMVELTAFTTQLQQAAEQLSSEPVDGPCDDGCACMTPTASTGPSTAAATVTLEVKPTEVPIACTLEPGAMPDRLSDWSNVLDHATSRQQTGDGVLRIEFDSHVDVAELARLVAAEQHCCTFFSFAVTVDHRGTALEVRAPADAAAIVTELFGSRRVGRSRA